jgi:hypothetical protein
MHVHGVLGVSDTYFLLGPSTRRKAVQAVDAVTPWSLAQT